MEIKVSPNSRGQRGLSTRKVIAPVLAALASVDAVCVFAEKRATRFLEKVQPDIYVKGGDYTLETLDSDERQAVLSHGGSIVFIPFWKGVDHPNHPPHGLRECDGRFWLPASCPSCAGQKRINIGRSGKAPWPTCGTSPTLLDMVRNRACAMENLLQEGAQQSHRLGRSGVGFHGHSNRPQKDSF